MRSLTIDTWMVGWVPSYPAGDYDKRPAEALGVVKVGPWPDNTGWSDSYEATAGCCDAEHHKADLEGKVSEIFMRFHTLVVRDGIDPQAAHREFLKIDEYRRRIAVEIDGADLEQGAES